MGTRPLLHYLPLVAIGCMLCMIIGVGIWVHYTVVLLHQTEYAMQLLGPNVTATDFGRGIEAVKGTSSSYMLFACALFGLGLYRKLLSAEADVSGSKAKRLKIYQVTNAVVHFLWWLIMVWIVVLMMGLSVLAILTWVGHHAAEQVLANQASVASEYSQRKGAVGATALAAAGGDLLHAVLLKEGWSGVAACPATCADLSLFVFLKVDASDACVCSKDVLQTVVEATRTALDAVPGMLVGIWFMYTFGDFFKTSLACDFTSSSRDADGMAMRNSPSMGRGYSKL